MSPHEKRNERTPLALRTPLQPSSKTAVLVPSNMIKRKSSMVLRLDSSEDAPSSHSSIVDATYHSNQNSDENGMQIARLDTDFRSGPDCINLAASTRTTSDEVMIRVSRPTTPESGTFLYGRGTTLDTIIEQKSVATMRSNCTISPDSSPSRPLLKRPSNATISPAVQKRRSLSLDDLTQIKRAYHDACTAIDRAGEDDVEQGPAYAGARTPQHAPLWRPETPPGMPSWTLAQDPTYRLSRRRDMRSRSLLRRLRTNPQMTRLINSCTARTRSVSQPLAPRFRPPRSVYEHVAHHPFYRAQVITPEPSFPRSSCLMPRVAAVDTQQERRDDRNISHVRFTPSATARDSEIQNLENAIEATQGYAVHPLDRAPFHMPPPAGQTIFCPHARQTGSSHNITEVGTTSLSDHGIPSYISLSSTLATTICSSGAPEISAPSVLSGMDDTETMEMLEGTPDLTSRGLMSTPSILGATSCSTHHTSTLIPTPLELSLTNRSDASQNIGTRKPCWRCNIKKVLVKVGSELVSLAAILCFPCAGCFHTETECVDARANSQAELSNLRPWQVNGPRPMLEIRGEGWIIGAPIEGN